MHPYFHFFGLTLPAYGCMMALALIAAGALGAFRVRSHRLQMEDALIVSACAIGLGLLCAKLLYLFLTFSPEELFDRLSAGDTSIFSGGFVFYGGLIGGIVGARIGFSIAKCPVAPMIRALLPSLPLAHAIGRVGCFLAGCCYGCPWTGPFAVPMPPSAAMPGATCFPVQPAESLWNLLILLVLLSADRKLRSPLSLSALYGALYAAGRFWLEFFRGDAARGLWNGISTSQWISIAVLLAALCAFFLSVRKKRTGPERTGP